MAFQIDSIQSFWNYDLNRDGKISKDESAEATDTYDVNDSKTVELWEYMQKVNEQRMMEIYKNDEISIWKTAYDHFEEFKTISANIEEHGIPSSDRDLLNVLELMLVGWLSDSISAVAEGRASEIPTPEELFENVKEPKWVYNLLGWDRRYLFQFAERGLIDKIGIQNFNKIAKIGDSSLRGNIYYSLLNVSDEHLILLFDKIGVDNLIQIGTSALIAGAPADPYNSLSTLVEKGLADKIGPSNLAKIAEAAGWRTEYAFGILLRLDKKGLIDLIGIDNLVNIASNINHHQGNEEEVIEAYYLIERLCNEGFSKQVVEIINAASWNAGFALSMLEHLYIDKHLITKIGYGIGFLNENYDNKNKLYLKIGMDNLAKIAKVAKWNTGYAYSVLRRLDKKGLINKIGIPKLVKIAQKAGPNTYREYEKLLTEETK